ncbi:hypothetical protein [Sporomusa sp.]|uniref:hypothetical protein n=1 Tax=Sporomusa sp. TaxID=2078658 RepID=UPI002BDC309F|nr:hypothetical protein [Sporomusa sp.]HWR42687.1 hypothetical protein [Sporomusa sp.]
MTYRANGSYLRFKTRIKSTSILPSAGLAMDIAITENHKNQHLRDEPSVRQSQNVYDALSE